MPPPTQRWMRSVRDGEGADRQREVEVAVRRRRGRARPSRRRGRPARARRSGRAPRSSGAPVTEPPGKTASSSSARPTSGRSVPSTVETRCVTPASSRSTSSSGQRTDPGSQTRARSLRSRSTIIMCSAASLAPSTGSPAGRVPLIGQVQTRRPRRARKSSGEAETIAQPSPTSGSRHERPQLRERARERARIAGEGSREVLDEVDLVDVAPRDRRANRLDRLGVAGVAPGAAPLADPNVYGASGCGARRIEQATSGSPHGSGGAGAAVRRSGSESP